MRAFVFLFSLSILFPALAYPSVGQEIVVWKSDKPTYRVEVRRGASLLRVVNCYATIYRVKGEKGLFRRQRDCMGDPQAGIYTDVGWPADGSLPVNMTGVHESHIENAYINGKGMLVLR